MESSTILTADVLDILFEGRNKEYGAYDLRRTYKKRLVTSITVMLSVLLLCCLGFVFANDKKKQIIVDVIPDDVTLKNIEQQQPVEPPPPPPPPKMQEPPKVEILKFTPPVIVNDDQVKKEDMPPETDKLVDTKIGSFNQDGVKDEGLVAPPIETGGKGIIELPVKEEEDYNKVFTKVEIESGYPGGIQAWIRFLNKNLRPSDEVQGTVVVQFIVDKEGNVTNVEAVSGPDELRSEAVRVIRKSGKWTPAIQNGHQVISQRRQPIIFRIEASE
jgi:periplasmic protein TonB